MNKVTRDSKIISVNLSDYAEAGIKTYSFSLNVKGDDCVIEGVKIRLYQDDGKEPKHFPHDWFNAHPKYFNDYLKKNVIPKMRSTKRGTNPLLSSSIFGCISYTHMFALLEEGGDIDPFFSQLAHSEVFRTINQECAELEWTHHKKKIIDEKGALIPHPHVPTFVHTAQLLNWMSEQPAVAESSLNIDDYSDLQDIYLTIHRIFDGNKRQRTD